MKLISGTIYIVKTKWGEVHEAEFRASVNGALVFSSLPFRFSKESPRILAEEDVEWAEPICEMTNFLTENMYNETIMDKFA